MNKIFSNRIVQAGLALSVVAASYFIYTTNTESSTMDNIETVSSAQENTEGLIIKTIPAVNMATEDIVVETVASPVASEKSSLKGKIVTRLVHHPKIVTKPRMTELTRRHSRARALTQPKTVAKKIKVSLYTFDEAVIFIT